MNKTRCPWCGKLIDKQADSSEYAKKHFRLYLKSSFGRHYGVCSYCQKTYNNIPKSAPICSIVMIGICALAMLFPFLLYVVFALAVPAVLISSMPAPLKRIDDNNSGVVKYDEALKFKARIIKQYYDMDSLEIFPIFSEYDKHEPFSVASPIFITSVQDNSDTIEGYWLYDHRDNAYFASRDCVHLYDDDGRVVADITFKQTLT